MNARIFAPHNETYYRTSPARSPRRSVTQRTDETPKASDRQLEFLASLREQKVLDASQDAILTTALAHGLNVREASGMIDWLKTLPRKQAQAKPTAVQVTEGMWLIGQEVIKVQRAVHGSGNLYGKALDRETGRFEYQPGLTKRLAQHGVRMTLEQAREFGHLYGMCCVCGATLTDEHSIEAGIGPVCATKF